MLDMINEILWGKVLIMLLVAVGLLFSIASRFVQFRYFSRMFTIFAQAFDHPTGQINAFQALVLSVAGRVGAGNIAGVAVAITLGGPGAVFWMWVIGLMGMATSFLECSLAQLFKRTEPDGTFRGGPAYYIAYGLNQRWLAGLFSLLLLVSFGFCFNALQSYTVATSLNEAFGVPLTASGIGMAGVLAVIIFGGIQRIVKVAEIVVPIMAAGYVVIALMVMATHIDQLPGLVLLIVKSAFGIDPAIGGGIGAAIMMGVKRGLFSNEAGLGSAPNIAAVAYVKHPASQGVVQAFSVFIDTLILCSCTAAIILLSSAYQAGTEQGGVVLTQISLAEHVGEWGRSYISIALVLFAFSSIMYNYYLGENSLNYFSEENKTLFTVYRLMTLALIFWGSMQDLSTIFSFADVAMGLLALVNLIALFFLFKIGLRIMRDFDQQICKGVAEPVLNVGEFSDLNIDQKTWSTTELAGKDQPNSGTQREVNNAN